MKRLRFRYVLKQMDSVAAPMGGKRLRPLRLTLGGVNNTNFAGALLRTEERSPAMQNHVLLLSLSAATGALLHGSRTPVAGSAQPERRVPQMKK